MTPTMSQFVEQNKQYKIVEGYRVTREGREARNAQDMKDMGGLKYRLENGETHWLTPEDIQSAPKFMPVWVES